MEIKIISIELTNFKGISSYKLELDGKNAIVSGENGIGKTTLADSFTWLLFGKNTMWNSLNPKPLDENNKEMLGVDPNVKAELLINGESVTLERSQVENWTKKRGSLEETRGGDKTNYKIDSVPAKQKEYNEYISSLFDEEKIKMLVNSSYFMQTLNWKDRRAALIEMTGITDEQIMTSKPEFKELSELLGSKTIEEMGKIIGGKQKEIKVAINGLPDKIQENHNLLQELELGDETNETLGEKLKESLAKIDSINKEISLLKNSGGQELSKQTRINEIKNEMRDIEYSISQSNIMQVESIQNDLNEVRKEMAEINNQKMDLKAQVSILENKKALDEQTKSQLLIEYKELSNKKQIIENTCECCGQSIPEETKQKQLEEFNIRKSNHLEEIKTTGKKLAADIEKYENELKELKDKLSPIELTLEAKSEHITELESELDTIKRSQSKVSENAKYKELSLELESVENSKPEIDTTKINELEEQKLLISNEVADLNKKISTIEQAERLNKRIDELRKQDGDLKDEHNKLSGQLFMIEEFTRTKVRMIEDNVNNRFKYAKFKLFDELKNGGLNEVCEATYKGIEYSSGLNTASRVNCDIDIINTLSREFKINAPLFIDNAESINNLIDVESQSIELIVSKDKKIKLEIKGDK